MDEGLASGRLARATLDHLPHDHLFDRGRIYFRAGYRLADDHGAQLRRAERGESAQITADGSAYGRDDDGSGAIAHGILVRFGFSLRSNYVRSRRLSPLNRDEAPRCRNNTGDGE